MNLKIIIVFIFLGIVIGAGALVTLFYKRQEVPVCAVLERKPTVVCTTTFIADLVHQIVDDKVEVIALMQPGIDPHTYKVQPHDVEKLSKADLVLYHGLALEGKMAEVLAQFSHAYAVTDVLSADQLLCADELFRIYDPHVWFDPNLWMRVASGLLVPLARIKADCADFFAQRIEIFSQELQLLDVRIREICATIPSEKRVLVTAHDAFGYFGKAYDFQVKGLQGLSTEAEVGVRDITDLADFIVEHNVKAIFGETSVPRKALEAVAQAVIARGKNVVLGPDLCSDSLGATHETATYQAMLYSFAQIITHYLAEGER